MQVVNYGETVIWGLSEVGADNTYNYASLKYAVEANTNGYLYIYEYGIKSYITTWLNGDVIILERQSNGKIAFKIQNSGSPVTVFTST